jgi:hypothetical protein
MLVMIRWHIFLKIDAPIIDLDMNILFIDNGNPHH